MPVPEYILSRDELITAVGGPQVAAKLADERKVGKPWDVLLDEARRWGTNQVLMAYGVQQEVQSLVPPYPPALVMLAQWFGAAQLWILAGKGDAVPKYISENETRAQTLCGQLIERKRNTATTIEPPNQHEIVVVDPDPARVQVTRTTMRGFW